jgi:hypothetical protein
MTKTILALLLIEEIAVAAHAGVAFADQNSSE